MNQLSFSIPPLVRKTPAPISSTLLMTIAKESGKSRSSKEEIAPELKPLISKIVKSGTRTTDQHQALAKAVVDYLKKNGVKSSLNYMALRF